MGIKVRFSPPKVIGRTIRLPHFNEITHIAAKNVKVHAPAIDCAPLVSEIVGHIGIEQSKRRVAIVQRPYVSSCIIRRIDEFQPNLDPVDRRNAPRKQPHQGIALFERLNGLCILSARGIGSSDT